MKANVGDWLVIKGRTTERSTSGGLSPRCTLATVVPGPDVIVVTPQEQDAADERAQDRAAHRATHQ